MITRLGHYDIVDELGRGGMGVVYKGYEPALGRHVAIKVLSSAMADDDVSVQRFLREARAMATLNDAHIIQIYFIGQDEGQTFFVMEYVDGEALSSVLKREPRIAVGDALKILLQASQGLVSAHAHGVIHRDIKPGNLMISTRGQVKLTDFGIALASHETSRKLTTTGGFVGTPGYLSPEVCLGKTVDPRSDIFAMGIVLFEMLSGVTPFKDESPLKEMLDVVENAAPDIQQLNPAVDAETARILGRMLAKSPDDRYQSCAELNADLKRHPLVADETPLQLLPRRSAGAGLASTLVGRPAAAPGEAMANAGNATVAPRTPLPQAGAHSLTGEASAITRTLRPRRTINRSLLIACAAATLALVAWLLGRAGQEAPAAVAGMATAPAAIAQPRALGVPSTIAVSTPGFGHGGEHSARNRVRLVASNEPAPALAATPRVGSPKRAAKSSTNNRQARARNDRQPSALTRAHRRFLCRAFKKCGPPARKGART